MARVQALNEAQRYFLMGQFTGGASREANALAESIDTRFTGPGSFLPEPSKHRKKSAQDCNVGIKENKVVGGC